MGERGSILLICFNMPNLPTIGTLARRPGGNLIQGPRRSSIAGTGFLVQLFLLLPGLSAGLVFL